MVFDPVSRLLFPSPNSSYDHTSFLSGELIYIPATKGLGHASPSQSTSKIPCIFLPCPTARFILVYFHSNAEDLGKCRAFLEGARHSFQVHVFAVEYPGYGTATGGPCDEKGAMKNAMAAMKFICEDLQWPLDSILLLGRSIGCGFAIAMATMYAVSGIILVSPMLSLRELCKHMFGRLAPVIEERFPNDERIKKVKSALLVIHGQQDAIIPSSQGMELYRRSRARKLFVSPPNMKHNDDLFLDPHVFVLPMLQFFSLPDYCFEAFSLPTSVFPPSFASQAVGDAGLHTLGLTDKTVINAIAIEDNQNRHDETICSWMPGSVWRGFLSSAKLNSMSTDRSSTAGLAEAGPETPKSTRFSRPGVFAIPVFVSVPTPSGDVGNSPAEVNVEGSTTDDYARGGHSITDHKWNQIKCSNVDVSACCFGDQARISATKPNAPEPICQIHPTIRCDDRTASRDRFSGKDEIKLIETEFELHADSGCFKDAGLCGTLPEHRRQCCCQYVFETPEVSQGILAIEPL